MKPRKSVPTPLWTGMPALCNAKKSPTDSSLDFNHACRMGRMLSDINFVSSVTT
jgi:hypothetical protein